MGIINNEEKLFVTWHTSQKLNGVTSRLYRNKLNNIDKFYCRTFNKNRVDYRLYRNKLNKSDKFYCRTFNKSEVTATDSWCQLLCSIVLLTRMLSTTELVLHYWVQVWRFLLGIDWFDKETQTLSRSVNDWSDDDVWGQFWTMTLSDISGVYCNTKLD